MKSNLYPWKSLLLLLLVAFTALSLRAQDVHYSQFHNAPFTLNPALTGIFRGNIRLSGNYRSQWSSVPVDYQSFTLAADKKFLREFFSNGFFSGGINLNYDRAGYSKLSNLQFNLSGSYTHKLTPHIYAGAGLQLGAVQRRFKLDELTFDNQYDNNAGLFDPSRDIGENLDNLNTNNSFMDLAGGINIRFQSLADTIYIDKLDQRTKLDLGVAFFHINRPDQSFIEGATSQLPLRISPYLMATLQIAKNVDLVSNLTVQFQDVYREAVMGLAGRFHLNREPGKDLALQVGGHLRLVEYTKGPFQQGDAFFPSIELLYKNWQVGFTYDGNVSKFDIATNGRGGPEFSVQYFFRKLPRFNKACPII